MLARLTARPNRMWAVSPFELDRVFADFMGDLGRENGVNYEVDVREDADHVYVEAELPGLTKEDIDITLENGVMTIRGEKKLQQEKTSEGFHVRERRFGRFCRSFQLPVLVEENKVDATLKDGVLLVKLNKREEVKPKRIEVKVK